MNDADRSWLTRLFGRVVAFLIVFIVVAMVVGLIAARLLHLDINADRIWSTLGNAFQLMIMAALVHIQGRPQSPPEKPGEPK